MIGSTGNKPNIRTAFLLIPVLCLLAACGFHPVYGGHGPDGSPVAEQMSEVAIDSIPDRPGQMLRNDLIDRFYGNGRPAQPLYHLSVKLRIAQEDMGVLANATTTLAALHATGDYTLKDANGKVLTSGSTQSTSTYDELTSMYATQAAKDSATERTVREVGEQITGRISLYFSERPAKP